ncbi:MAG: DNA-binding protein [Alcanivorax sp.]|nr:DNA-binding protein [Alcanivorax sp.]
MAESYEFELHCALPDAGGDAETWLDALFEAGCDDALVGIAVPGHVALSFTREGGEAMSVLLSAVSDVQRAIPGALLVSAAPDLLNLAEVATVLTDHGAPITRQAMRKYASGEAKKRAAPFPAPGVSGGTPLWHLDDVLGWMLAERKLPLTPALSVLHRLARATKALNATCEYRRACSQSPELVAAAEREGAGINHHAF